jgi:hypothetical protein
VAGGGDPRVGVPGGCGGTSSAVATRQVASPEPAMVRASRWPPARRRVKAWTSPAKTIGINTALYWYPVPQ